jgi:hypothetical protein
MALTSARPASTSASGGCTRHACARCQSASGSACAKLLSTVWPASACGASAVDNTVRHGAQRPTQPSATSSLGPSGLRHSWHKGASVSGGAASRRCRAMAAALCACSLSGRACGMSAACGGAGTKAAPLKSKGRSFEAVFMTVERPPGFATCIQYTSTTKLDRHAESTYIVLKLSWLKWIQSCDSTAARMQAVGHPPRRVQMQQRTFKVETKSSHSSLMEARYWMAVWMGSVMNGSCCMYACMTSSFWLISRSGRTTQQPLAAPLRESSNCKLAGAR